ncbi:hypothetical protein GUJ93_ZPchr0007g4401 [Zizania palustris]|uniref:RING-type domain-containing protein n=1 Tax=Zizania palustris TaxID=103762 RepID=A0A8J5T448_ZIZPA|nr:hypothetical protein GUJ93_ZPchr0007g4401 [Zizania palustris]
MLILQRECILAVSSIARAPPPHMDSIIAPAAPTTAAQGWRLTYTGASCLTAASIVLLLLYLTGRFIWQYSKDAAAAAAAPSSPSPPPSAAAPPRRAVPLSMLPVFVHTKSPGATTERSPECAVCLTEFGARDTGRLLPSCGHGFHDECIVTWLRVNTTCPLCRAAVAAK